MRIIHFQIPRGVNLLLPVLFAILHVGYAQEALPEEEHFEVVDIQPDFPGGMHKFYQYVHKHLKYPKQAVKDKIEGKVFVAFVVDSTGVIREDSVQIVQGIGHGCDEEVIRVIRNSPPWTPGRISKWNKNVPVRMVLPITFKR